jgi:hypothetical protein
MTTNATVHEILVAARALISDPENWVQRAYVLPARDGGQKYCAVGAVYTAASLAGNKEETIVCGEILRQCLPYLPIPSWDTISCISEFNDWHTHAQVLALFDYAIACTAPHKLPVSLQMETIVALPKPTEMEKHNEDSMVGTAQEAAS